MTLAEIQAAACESKIACLNDKDLLIVIAEAIRQGGGGGGGDATLFSVIKDIPNAQILTLPSTPVEMVAPTEILGYVGAPTQLPLVESGYVRWKTFVANLGNVTTSSFKFAWGSDYSADASNSIAIDMGNSHLLPFGTFGKYTVGTVNLEGGLQDNGVFIAVSNGGNFTGGNAGNILQVALFYRIWDFTTGQFIEA